MTLDVEAGEGTLLGYLWITMSCLQVALQTIGYGVFVGSGGGRGWEWEVGCVCVCVLAPSFPSIFSFLLENIESPVHQLHGSLM